MAPPAIPFAQSTAFMLSNQAYSPLGTFAGVPLVAKSGCSAPTRARTGTTGALVGLSFGVIITLVLLCLVPWLGAKRGWGARLAGMEPGTGMLHLAWRPPLFLAFACALYAQSVSAWGEVQQASGPDETFWGLSASFGLQGLAFFVGFLYACVALFEAKRAKAIAAAGSGGGPKPSLLLFASLALYMLQQATVAWTATTEVNLAPSTYCAPGGADPAGCAETRRTEQLTCYKHMRTIVQAGGGFGALFAFAAFFCAVAAVLTRLGIKTAAAAGSALNVKQLKTGLPPSRQLSNAMLALKLGGVVCAIVGLASDQLTLGGTSFMINQVCSRGRCSSKNLPEEFKAALAMTILALLTAFAVAAVHALSIRSKAAIRHRQMGMATVCAAIFFCAAFASVAKWLGDLDEDQQRIMEFGAGFSFNVLGFLLMLAHSVFSIVIIKADGAAGGAVAPGAAGGAGGGGAQQQVQLPSPLVACAFAWAAFMLDVACADSFYATNRFKKEQCAWAVVLCGSDAACRADAAREQPQCQYDASTYPLSAYKASHVIPGLLELAAAIVLALVVLGDKCACLAKRTRESQRAGGGGAAPAAGARDFIWHAWLGALCVAAWARAHQSLSLGDMSSDVQGVSGWVCALCLFGFFVACSASAYVTAVAFVPGLVAGDKAAARTAFLAPWNLFCCALGTVLFAVCVSSGYTADVIAKAKSGHEVPTREASSTIAGLATLAGFFFAMAAALVPDVNLPQIAFPKMPKLTMPEMSSGSGVPHRGEIASDGQHVGNPLTAGDAAPFCANCGSKQAGDTKFCSQCGTPKA